MNGPRKPPAKIEGRKRMQVSGLTVAWHGTRSLKDWTAYVEIGNGQGRLVLADQVSERALKSLLARIQTLSRAELEAMSRPVETVAAQGGGPSVRRPRGGEDEAPPSSQVIAHAAPGRQLALAGDGSGQAPPASTSRQRRAAVAAERTPPAESRRPARATARDLPGTVRQLRSRIESLEEEHEHLRAELALLRGDAEAYDGPPSLFVTGWFRAALVLIVLAIVVVLTVPWLMDLVEGDAREPRPPARSEALAPTPNPVPGDR